MGHQLKEVPGSGVGVGGQNRNKGPEVGNPHSRLRRIVGAILAPVRSGVADEVWWTMGPA